MMKQAKSNFSLLTTSGEVHLAGELIGGCKLVKKLLWLFRLLMLTWDLRDLRDLLVSLKKVRFREWARRVLVCYTCFVVQKV
jgi:hypothetical protein